MYVSDSLLLIQKTLGIDQKYRYADFMEAKPLEKEDKRTGEEIISDISKKVRGY